MQLWVLLKMTDPVEMRFFNRRQPELNNNPDPAGNRQNFVLNSSLS